MKDVPSSSIEDWKKGYMFFLKKVSIANNHRQLVLKNPPNTARIKLLLSLFPDAKFIHIVRNPFDVFASNRRFWEVIRNNYVLGSTRSVNTDRLILDSYAGIMQQYQEQKELIPQKRLVEISYEDFIDQPVQTMRNLYSKFELGDFELCKPAMINFVDQQKKYELLHHRLDKESKNLIVQKWDPYIKLWIGLNNSQSYITPTE